MHTMLLHWALLLRCVWDRGRGEPSMGGRGRSGASSEVEREVSKFTYLD